MFASHPQLPATASGAGVPNRRRPEHSALPHRPSANLSCRRPGRCCAITQHRTAAQTAWRGHRMTQTADPGAAPERSSSAGIRRRTTRPPHGEASGRRGVGMAMTTAAEASCPAHLLRLAPVRLLVIDVVVWSDGDGTSHRFYYPN